jgi:hypothetical protein
LAYPNSKWSHYPTNPVVGDYHTDIHGNVDVWDGYSWQRLHTAPPSTLGGVKVGSGITMATTAYVSSAMQSTVTFNHSDGKQKVTGDEIIEFMAVMKKRMLIITNDFEKHEKYPALKQAYENYLLIERLCCGDEINEEDE